MGLLRDLSRPLSLVRRPPATRANPAPPQPWEMTFDELMAFRVPSSGDRSRDPSSVPEIRAEATLLRDYPDPRDVAAWLGSGFADRRWRSTDLVDTVLAGGRLPIWRTTTAEKVIWPGAYVTLSRAYAMDHGRRNLGGEPFHLLRGWATPDELEAMNPQEFFWLPKDLRAWHQDMVRRALALGERVPDRVLAGQPGRTRTGRRPGVRRNPDGAPAWPDRIDGSEQPLQDWFDEYDEVPDEATLLRLFEHEKQIEPSFTFKKIRLAPERPAYITWSSVAPGRRRDAEPEFVYQAQADGSFDRDDPHRLLDDISMMGRAAEYFDFDPEEKFNEEFWSSPGTLLHGTQDLATVLAEGIEPRSDSRGLGNRAVGAAVFATHNDVVAEDYGRGPDGGVVRIDMAAMKRDGYMPFVAEEPEVMEQDLLGAIAHRLGIEHDIEYGDSGIDPDTVIIHGHVPAKYLQVAG